MVNVRKRGNVYEYNFDVAKIEGKRKRISKSGFKTKAEAQEAYKNIIDKYLKPLLGSYRLSATTSVILHSFLTELCSKYSFSRSYFKNILKVMKGTFREATDVYGFIRYNPSLTLKLPKIEDSSDFEKTFIYTR